MTKKAAKPQAFARSLDDLTPQTKRMYVADPVTLQDMQDVWIDLAGVMSDQFDDAKAAMTVAARNEPSLEEMDPVEAEKVKQRRQRELIGRLVVAWNEDYFGPFSTQAAIDLMCSSKGKLIYVQADLLVSDLRNFFKA